MRVFDLFHDRRAGVAPLVALAAVPLIASVGAAVDYGRVNALRTSMQNSLDAAALVLSQQALQLSSDQLSQDATTQFLASSSAERKGYGQCVVAIRRRIREHDRCRLGRDAIPGCDGVLQHQCFRQLNRVRNRGRAWLRPCS